MVSDKIFSCFSLYKSLLNKCPLGRGHFWPQGHNLIELGRRLLSDTFVLHTIYQGSRSNGFRQEDFFMFLPIQVYDKQVTPGAGPFLAPGT